MEIIHDIMRIEAQRAQLKVEQADVQVGAVRAALVSQGIVNGDEDRHPTDLTEEDYSTSSSDDEDDEGAGGMSSNPAINHIDHLMLMLIFYTFRAFQLRTKP